MLCSDLPAFPPALLARQPVALLLVRWDRHWEQRRQEWGQRAFPPAFRARQLVAQMLARLGWRCQEPQTRRYRWRRRQEPDL